MEKKINYRGVSKANKELVQGEKLSEERNDYYGVVMVIKSMMERNFFIDGVPVISSSIEMLRPDGWKQRWYY